MKKVIFLVVAVFVASVVVTGGLSFAATAQERAIMKAKEAAQDKGIIVGDAELIYDSGSKKWEERVAAVESMPSDPNYGELPHGMLYNRKYEVVLLDFKEDAKEADAWIFMDKDTGDVITVYQEKR